MVVLVSIAMLSFAAIAIWAPQDVRTALFGVHGLVSLVTAYLLGSPLERRD